ncbi:DNA mismatch repair protein MutS [Prochlorococcus sp. MIT 1300]|uniref:DNA mismatch repair protein MutS n=1 Tax=Prochlorococcus sp. MIT 1300 TaxID=3096218 RepID=UPI002A75990B|nr:DNA mismatch repair protein MutS [Prochlorococcus sp. MIT 1300]
MVAEAESLQGSLFGETAEVLGNSNSSHKLKTPDLQPDLSDEQLLADALKRPRQNKAPTTQEELSAEVVSDEKQKEPLKAGITKYTHHTQINEAELTPVLRHYVELKGQHPERILLYRLGDFFECFFEDAIKISQLLEITLTGKDGGKTIGRIPMAGIPHHATERYCSEIIKKGLSVALCDQLENKPSKGTLIKRQITKVLTPGTVIAEGMLAARRNNWLAAVLLDQNTKDFQWGLATVDVSTGEFLVTERSGKTELFQELTKLEVSELLISENNENSAQSWCPEYLPVTKVATTPFSRIEAEQTLKKHFKIETLYGLGLENSPLALRAAGGLLNYLRETHPVHTDDQKNKEVTPFPLDKPQKTTANTHLILDSQTRRNLELTCTQKDGQLQGSLLWALDRTLTAMGGRCLRRWIELPLIDQEQILARQTVISALVNHRTLRQELRRLLKTMGDLERLAGRAGGGHSGARDLQAIADGIERLPKIANLLKGLTEEATPKWFKELQKVEPQLLNLATFIRHHLYPNPPLSLTEGGIIRDGVDQILDGLRNHLDDQNTWLNNQENIERKISGNTNLKIQYHRTFGYFLSVSKAKAGNVPEHWIRRQTLANEERFITPDLKAREGRIFQAKARTAQKEYELFCKLRESVGEHTELIRKSARSIAALDAITGLAEVAATNNYCRPEIIAKQSNKISRTLVIKGCRHPVVELLISEKRFTPNNISLGKGTDLMVLTGPNASGKSCFLRQIGLIQLMSQIGSWIPAKEAHLSLTDQIFTRVGAVDDLATGKSTFMVEMAETAYILNHATKHSLVLLDEIGRGTATFDGLSIAWAVSEFLAQKLKSRSIFATHYHELNELSNELKNVDNFQVLVKETGEDLVFLHQVVPGGASKSYGIEVARLAGVPQIVIESAERVLSQLQEEPSSQIIQQIKKRQINSPLSAA